MKSMFSVNSDQDSNVLDSLIDWNNDKQVIDLLERFYQTRSLDTCSECILDIMVSSLTALNCKRMLRDKDPVDLELLKIPSLIRATLVDRVGKK